LKTEINIKGIFNNNLNGKMGEDKKRGVKSNFELVFFS
jgi:hypothetical protein